MDAHEQPTPEEARASLEQITASRTAAAQATRRPAWIDLGIEKAMSRMLPSYTWRHAAAIPPPGSEAMATLQQ